jgi:hypothetical protein
MNCKFPLLVRGTAKLKIFWYATHSFPNSRGINENQISGKELMLFQKTFIKDNVSQVQ